MALKQAVRESKFRFGHLCTCNFCILSALCVAIFAVLNNLCYLQLSLFTNRYDMRKYVFTQRIINILNSLPVHVANSSSINSFKNNLDIFWSNQEVYYNFRCDISGTGNRSLS